LKITFLAAETSFL